MLKQIGYSGDNLILWTRWNDAIIRITMHINNNARGKDYYNVVCMDCKGARGSAFRTGYQIGLETGETMWDFGFTTTTDYNYSELMLFDYNYVCLAFPDFDESQTVK